MSGVRVLVGTRKGAFVLTADGRRDRWDVAGPFFAGWEIYHVKGSPADPDRIWASQSSSWFGQQIQRSDDGGQTWEPVGNEFRYEGVPGTHQWYDGTPHPWEFARVWHLEPSATDPDFVYAGVEDAALFCSSDAGASWRELPGLREHGSGPAWQPGAGGMCLHTILVHPTNPQRLFIAISAAGAFRSDDGAKTWQPINRGLVSEQIPNPTAEVGHCVHRLALHPSLPDVLFMQKHWDVMRSDDGGDSWREISGNLPSDFGFPIDVHAHERAAGGEAADDELAALGETVEAELRGLRIADQIDHRLHFHAVIGGFAESAGQLLAMSVVKQHHAVAARPRIAGTGAVRVDLDAVQEMRRAAGSARPPITAVRRRLRRRTGVIECTRLRARSRYAPDRRGQARRPVRSSTPRARVAARLAAGSAYR